MVTEAAVWAIFLLPLGSFALIALVIRPFLNRWPILAAISAIASLIAAVVLSVHCLAFGHPASFHRIRDMGLAVFRRGDDTDGPAGGPTDGSDAGGGLLGQPAHPDFTQWDICEAMRVSLATSPICPCSPPRCWG